MCLPRHLIKEAAAWWGWHAVAPFLDSREAMAYAEKAAYHCGLRTLFRC
jgi:hypothetical protein